MRIIKKAVLGFTLLLAAIWAITAWMGVTVVLPIRSPSGATLTGVEPFERSDFKDGRWRAYLILGRGENLGKASGNCFVLDDANELNSLRNSWRFAMTGGDMTTVSSYVVVTHNGKIVYRVSVVVDGHVGVQSEDDGWLEPVDSMEFKRSFSSFRRYRWPILFL